YFEAKDAAKIRTLVYWSGVQERERDAFNKSLEADFQFKVRRVEMISLHTKLKMEHVQEGIIFRPTLEPIGRLIVIYEPKRALTAISSVYLVGSKYGRYYITLASPIR